MGQGDLANTLHLAFTVNGPECIFNKIRPQFSQLCKIVTDSIDLTWICDD